MKKQVIICDRCGRDLKNVNKESLSGRGCLTFEWTLGSYAGGGGNKIELNDLCAECTQSFKEHYKNWNTK